LRLDPDDDQLDGLHIGGWKVRGTLVQQGWGAALRYRALHIDPDAAEIDV
jgi:hypothetical protein